MLVGAFVLEFVLEVAWHLFLVQDGNFLLVSADDGIADAFLGANQLLVTFACLGTAAVIAIRWKRGDRPAAAGAAAERAGHLVAAVLRRRPDGGHAG